MSKTSLMAKSPDRRSISLYIHIPFCRQACAYCDFYFTVSSRLEKEYFVSLLNEIDARITYQLPQPLPHLSSLYFGGGTPSRVCPTYLKQIIDLVASHFSDDFEKTSSPLKQYPEITLEANPDDLQMEVWEQYFAMGINRVSIGIQSFDETTLKYLQRSHHPQQAEQVLRDTMTYFYLGKLSSWSFDLIYGIPTLSTVQWEQSIRRAIEYHPPHLSLYSLTVEPHTILHYQIAKKVKPHIEDGLAAEQFSLALNILEQHGYEHYEISNFALPGHHSQHNLRYWQFDPYLGFGPSAHSFYENIRFHNHPQLASYIRFFANEMIGVKSLEQFEQKISEIQHQEILTEQERYHEYLMVALRTQWGVDLNHVAVTFGNDRCDQLILQSRIFQQRNWLQQYKNHLRLTNNGKLFVDHILRELFIIAEDSSMG